MRWTSWTRSRSLALLTKDLCEKMERVCKQTKDEKLGMRNEGAGIRLEYMSSRRQLHLKLSANHETPERAGTKVPTCITWRMTLRTSQPHLDLDPHLTGRAFVEMRLDGTFVLALSPTPRHVATANKLSGGTRSASHERPIILLASKLVVDFSRIHLALGIRGFSLPP